MKAKQDLAHLLYSNNLSIKNKILFYKIVLRPILLYASPVWGSAAKTHFKRLQTFQNKTLQAIQKAPWYFSTSTCHTNLRMTSINTEIKNFLITSLTELLRFRTNFMTYLSTTKGSFLGDPAIAFLPKIFLFFTNYF